MMFRQLRAISFALIALILIGNIQIASGQSQIFTVYGDKPVVDHGKEGSWNSQYTDPGAVTYYKGQFYIFYNGFNGWPAPVQIGYATSPDGLNWTKQGDVPVLMTKDVPYAGLAALASSVLVEPDGTWVLYFYTWETRSIMASGKIGRATAKSPAGPWTADPDPVLEPGSKGSWDELRVDSPSVVKTDDGYVMYYAGANSKNVQMIGMATSADGITWKKYGDPVLMPGDSGAWDATRVHQPRVVKTPDGWVMVYRSVVFGTPSTIALGYALSTDGIHWTRSKNNPIMKAPDVFGKQGFWYTALTYADGTYYLYVEGQPGLAAETAVFVATHKGSLTE